MEPKNKSIRSNLLQLILTISSVSLLTAFVVLITYEIRSFRQTTAEQLNVLGNMLAQNSTAALAFNDASDAQQILSSVEAEPNIQLAVLYDNNGKIFAQTSGNQNNDAIPKIQPNDGLVKDVGFFELTIPVLQRDKRLGTLYLRYSTQAMNRKVGLYLLLVGAVLGLCFAMTYYLSRKFEKSITDPIISLAKTAEIISSQQDYSVRAKVFGQGEIHTLTTAFNLMLSRIDSQNQEIQRHAQELEHKVAERTFEIKRQRDFAETVINSSLVLIAVFDSDTRFLGFNRRCEMEFGRKLEDVQGKRFAEAMPAVVGSPAYKAVIRALNGEIAHFERYRSPVSGEYYEAFGIPLRNEKNEVYAAILTAHNITETVTANEKLTRSNEELRKKNADLEQFAYVASHDLQEPLRKIQMFADMAKKSITAVETVSKYLLKIESSARRMSSLIRDVLEYSRISRLDESFVSTDLNQILEYVKSDFELLIGEKNVTVDSDELPIIFGHQLQLHQLFANLINNAIKFCDKQPYIRITSLPATTDELQANNLDVKTEYYKLTISDNGIGFDPKLKEQIFTIFQRLHTRERYEGTGIGLALCKKIIENHHGAITVDSEANVGSTFTIFLPSGISKKTSA